MQKYIFRFSAALITGALILSACTTDKQNAPAGDTERSAEIAAPIFDASEGPPEPPAEPVVFDTSQMTLKVLQYQLDNQTVDFDNLWFYQELEAKTGVTVEWDVVRESEWNQKLNLTFASGVLPDVIIRPNNSLNIEELGVVQGLIIPLDDYLAVNMPNYYPRLFMNNVADSMISSDGKMYWIGNLSAQGVNHEPHFYINKTWLDAVGLDVPETVDELTEALIAFRDQNPGGVSTVLPMIAADLIHQTHGVYTHFSMFGVPLQRWIYAAIDDNNKVVFPGHMTGFREACEWLNMCYNEGLLDKDSITQDPNAWAVKMNGGQTGFTTYLRLINTQLNEEVQPNWLAISPPVGGPKSKAAVARTLEIPEFGAVITSANKNIERTLQWLDAQFETEMMLMSVNGPINEGAPIEPTLMLNDEGKYEVIYVPSSNGLYQVVPVFHGQFFAPGDYIFEKFVMPPHRLERFETSREYEQAGVLENNSFMILQKLVKLTSDEAAEQAYLFDSIETLMMESITNFITKGVTDESWQEFLDRAEGAGVPQYIATYQKAYDSYYAAQNND